MKRIIIILLFLLSVRFYGQEDNTLHTILLECIEESKNKYEKSITWTQQGHEMYLNPNGLPNQNDEFNKTFYDNLPLSLVFWGNPKKYGKVFDVMEVAYSLQNDIIEVRIALVTVTRKGKHFTHAIWFEDIDVYTYHYSCSNRQWERIPKCVYSDANTQSFVCIQNDSISRITNLNEKIAIFDQFSTDRNKFDLFLLLSAYHHYHLDYPLTIQDLIIFDSLSNTGQESSRYHNVITFLQKNKEKITWIATDYDIIVLMNNDTLVYYPGGDSHSICYSQYPSEKYIFRFFDHHHHYAYSEETEKMFKYGLKMLSMNFSPIEGGGLHIMVYTQKDGLQFFCDKDDHPIDSAWFSSVEKYVDVFSKQYNLGKIIFSIADLNTE